MKKIFPMYMKKKYFRFPDKFMEVTYKITNHTFYLYIQPDKMEMDDKQINNNIS